MSDFDIANLRGRSSFAANLQKRKALGLVDSDSEDELPRRKSTKTNNTTSVQQSTATRPISNDNIPTTTSTTTTTLEQPMEMDPTTRELQKTMSTTAQYFAVAEALMATPSPTIPQPKLKPNNSTVPNQNASFIELSDGEEEEAEAFAPIIPEEEIEDLDPSLQAYLNESLESTSVHQPQKISIKLQYVHNFTEVSEQVKAIIQKLLKPIKIIVMDTEQFHKVLTVFCNHKKLKKAEVVLTYKDDLIFPSTTPAGVGMSEMGTHNMQVYPKQCYEKMLKDKEQQRSERLQKWAMHDESTELPSQPSASTAITAIGTETEIAETVIEEGKIILKLRGKDKKEISLRVKPTNTLQSLLQSYKQHTGLTDELKLSLDGELLDFNQTIEDADLEDEDLIDVVVM